LTFGELRYLKPPSAAGGLGGEGPDQEAHPGDGEGHGSEAGWLNGDAIESANDLPGEHELITALAPLVEATP
jgi:hypothetical protein